MQLRLRVGIFTVFARPKRRGASGGNAATDEAVSNNQTKHKMENYKTIGKQHTYVGTNPVQLALDGKMREAVELLHSEFHALTKKEIWQCVNDVPNRKRRNRLAKLIRRSCSYAA